MQTHGSMANVDDHQEQVDSATSALRVATAGGDVRVIQQAVLECSLQAARGAGGAAELLQQAELVLNAERRLDKRLVGVLEQLAAHSPALQTEEAFWAVIRRLLDTGLHTIHAVTTATPETQAALGPGGAELYAKALQAWADRILSTRF